MSDILNRDPNYVQRGFGLKKEVAGELAADYNGGIVDALRARGNHASLGELELSIAEEFGFCYGVDRAIDYAYETRRHFPDKTIYVTNELIHNPFVNDRLREMGLRFFEDGYGVSDIQREDVCILPAFGATVELTRDIEARGAVIVDTTCGSVMNVWKRVELYGREGFTSIVHGKYSHEETVATCSRALSAGSKTFVIRNEAEAQLVIDHMLGRGMSAEALLERFKDSVSTGFDPVRDLQRVGIANQTTMLSSESSRISEMFEAALLERDGELTNFRRFDTICSATQDRQDAIIALGESRELDLILVVGGYNSSNTTHLNAIAGRYAPSYHIDGPAELLSAETIRHLPKGEKAPQLAEGWLEAVRRPGQPLRLGVTSGASTPNSIVSEVLARAAELCGIDLAEALEVTPLSPVDV